MTKECPHRIELAAFQDAGTCCGVIPRLRSNQDSPSGSSGGRGWARPICCCRGNTRFRRWGCRPRRRGRDRAAVVDELMRFVGFEDEGVAGFDARHAVLVTNGAVAGNDVVELPLGAVRMIGVGRFTGRNAADFDIEGVALHQISGARIAAEGFGDFLAGAGVFALRRRPRFFGEGESVDLVHWRMSLKFEVQSSRLGKVTPQIRRRPQMGG